MTVVTNHQYGIWELDSPFALYEITQKLEHRKKNKTQYHLLIEGFFLCVPLQETKGKLKIYHQVWGL